ncbi:hypothetical protein [Amycolatopsis palatopharyngis]|uniref:hypothetical protein n=1 Tax=Amycolatopsis palatopharyngis TaxID=187982 RepID=UPI0013BEAAC2|nr:hypothetical protein [Amycolatopsis palatopharyngis]
MTKEGQLPPLQSRLLLEACRIADRLDRLDRQLYGGDWLTFDADNDSGQVTVVVDRVLAESRQQALAFKQIVAELRQSQTISRPGRKPASAVQGKVKSSGGAGANISDLAAFAASRGASPAG